MRPRLLAALAFAVLALAPAVARAADPPDLVRMKDGSMYRGTIAELLQNDHVTIVLPTGETRRLEMKDVVSAGPAPTTPAAVVPEATPRTAGEEVAVTANMPDIALEYKVGQS